ncbi:heavy-metal-associated domain-containing protein [Sphingobacterium sp. SYP-B4668]|uniref:heavy-metal-associated domain-containing protein n=1 Tax=Sphingobacterium sp. SYP-B4668 TaxID=2996035 RepID=UPI0005324845|nr:heavy-metal-associated domain-containing protein [Sphingobacterium sp. SYP-B4668]
MESSNQNFQFKTNINCNGCVAKVSPFLNDAEGICHWEVDTASRDKVLTLKSEGITEQQVMETVQKAGFKIEPLAS